MIRRIAMAVILLVLPAVTACPAPAGDPVVPPAADRASRAVVPRLHRRIATLMRDLARMRREEAVEQDSGRRTQLTAAIGRVEARLASLQRELRYDRRALPRRLPPSPVHTRR